ncbi:hypothetical protein EKM02_00065 [Flavobacterium sp. RSP49]|uniref:GIN domain-containing protein n=1 Tax=Flavobacterium sp. RSP49 TaxID=2497487 RepID=UPI000F83D241|nr:DUF2807 domain-containing protein [Flavobacterium sp. RSP49]RTZ03273.1 hypothetical protein EKM02_00065 [Flavobacterium sp. RSP49]
MSNPNIKGNGTLISEKRTTTSYYKITVAGFFNVELILANEKNITIKGEENLLPNIKVEVIDQVLKIAAEKKINTSVPAKENKL